jgi:hypothetical protein
MNHGSYKGFEQQERSDMKKALTSTLMAAFAFVAIAAHAEEIPSADQNVIVDSRPLPPSVREQFEKQRQAESEQLEELYSEGSIELSAMRIIILPENEWDPAARIPILPQNEWELASCQNIHTASHISSLLYHSIDYFPQDNIVKTEDGAEWIFDSSDVAAVRNWKPDDMVLITPKGRWFWGSNYSYVMTNKDIGVSVDVNLFQGPIAFGTNSSWVIGVNQNLGQIYVMNGEGERSVWEISNVDHYLFKEWKVNDTIIMGQNDSWLWWFSSFDHIIVNVNMNHFVRAKQVSANHSFRGALAA